MKQLSEGEKEYYRDLEQNLNKHVEKYRKEKLQELQQGKKEGLEKELGRLEGYYESYEKNEVSDLEVNIDFCFAKINVLKEVLGNGMM
ncbi:MAG: hypothetical protein E4G94_07695 [ANME-2 cluster archaeon]|nr:MAG: hypothetical protein E4G94_07695 [ANME-2 cluster archaeon]